ncbi:MAG: molybdenum cofactor guanylyltransferase [Synechococcales bacterium]|nr:molybdenum cofactor guanylyltransferase [Synechococcales bacterium]
MSAPSPSASFISVLVLAGGGSSRMGTDKALLEVNGRPLLRQVYDVAVRCSPLVYVVTPWRDRYRAILPSDCRFIQETPAPAGEPPYGPLIGFWQGLAHVETDWVLVLACDLPRLQPSQLQHWATQVLSDNTEAIAHLPQGPKGWEPLCGFYHRHCRPSLETYLAQGGRSFQGWLAQQPVQALRLEETDAAAMLFNCNTPADLAQVRTSGYP